MWLEHEGWTVPCWNHPVALLLVADSYSEANIWSCFSLKCIQGLKQCGCPIADLWTIPHVGQSWTLMPDNLLNLSRFFCDNIVNIDRNCRWRFPDAQSFLTRVIQHVWFAWMLLNHLWADRSNCADALVHLEHFFVPWLNPFGSMKAESDCANKLERGGWVLTA